MLRRPLRSIRKHPYRSLLVALVAALVAFNVLAFMHAHAMTHFAGEGARPRAPEAMSAAEKARAVVLGVRVPKPRIGETPDRLGLAYEVHTFAVSNGGQCEAWHVGCHDSRGLCLLFHGYATCKSSLLPAAAALRELGYDALLVDFRGHGGSSGSETTIGFREADDVAAAFVYAGDRWPGARTILYGRSMGAAAILRAAAIHGVKPSVAIIECPFDRLITTVENRCRLVGIPTFPCAAALVFWGGVQHGYSGFAHNPVDYAAAVDCPVLFLHGALDTRVTVEQAREVFDNLRGEKRFVLFERVGHGSYVRAEPEAWRQAVAEFLGTVPLAPNASP